MKKVNLLFAIAISASMFMVSCGGDAAPAPEATPEVTEEAAPVSEAVVEEVEVATVDLVNGQAVYSKACFVCHDTGAGGAAKLDDKESWTVTASRGLETVNKHAIEGYTGEKGVMLAKGGNADLTDQETMDAVAYMLNKAGVIAE